MLSHHIFIQYYSDLIGRSTSVIDSIILSFSVFQGSEKIIEVAIEAMEVDDTLWVRYFDDFARGKLHLPTEITPLTRQILQVYIGIDALQSSDTLSKVVSLHVRHHVHQLDISNVVRVLKPVSELESSSLEPDPSTTLTFESLVSPKHSAGHKRLPNISSFIVTKLFETFCEAALKSTFTVKLTQCCKSYLDMVSSLIACYLLPRDDTLILLTKVIILSTDVYTFHGRGYSGWSH